MASAGEALATSGEVSTRRSRRGAAARARGAGARVVAARVVAARVGAVRVGAVRVGAVRVGAVRRGLGVARAAGIYSTLWSFA
jgi:hypothetical protein